MRNVCRAFGFNAFFEKFKKMYIPNFFLVCLKGKYIVGLKMQFFVVYRYDTLAFPNVFCLRRRDYFIF
jgi:hypothetical protein